MLGIYKDDDPCAGFFLNTDLGLLEVQLKMLSIVAWQPLGITMLFLHMNNLYEEDGPHSYDSSTMMKYLAI